MSFLNNSPFSPSSNVCPQCQAVGLTACQHVKQNQVSKPSVLKADLAPAASAALLKTVFLVALGAIGYLAWRSQKAGTEEDEAQAEPHTPFDEWEPNQ